MRGRILTFEMKSTFYGISGFQIPSKHQKETLNQDFLAQAQGSPCQQKGILVLIQCFSRYPILGIYNQDS